MESLFVLALVGATSLLAAVLVRWVGGPSRKRWQAAVVRALDAVGLGVVFFVANIALGTAVVLLTRAATGTFLSAYLVNDVTLAALSLLQGLVFAGLLASRRRARGPGGRRWGRGGPAP
ncbi:MAG TPA: hypothetical protein VNK50_00545 [Calidithermus sp.]|nr:hypothetical protein [Calidithermus sp.]